MVKDHLLVVVCTWVHGYTPISFLFLESLSHFCSCVLLFCMLLLFVVALMNPTTLCKPNIVANQTQANRVEPLLLNTLSNYFNFFCMLHMSACAIRVVILLFESGRHQLLLRELGKIAEENSRFFKDLARISR